MRHKPWVIVIGAYVIFFSALFLRVPAMRTVDAMAGSSKGMTLSEGLQQTIDLIDATATKVAPNGQVSAAADNPEIEVADELSNNYSLVDHSNRIRYPGYNDCDSWKNLVDDGWSAVYRTNIMLRDEYSIEQLLRQAKQFWDSEGYDARFVTDRTPGAAVTFVTNSASATGVFMDTGYANFRFVVEPAQHGVSISATTHCLPPQ